MVWLSSCSGPCYTIYCLTILMLCNLLLQIARFILAIVARPLAQELQFGDKTCMLNQSYYAGNNAGNNLSFNVSRYVLDRECANRNVSSCQSSSPSSSPCVYDYFGGGYEYQVLVGPVYIFVFTFSGILVGLLADRFNRSFLLATFLSLWSSVTVLTALADNYWQLVVLRLFLGIFQAGCVPFASSMIADLTTSSARGAAMAFFEFGIYFGFSLAYVIGNLVMNADLFGMGWRWAFAIAGVPGLVLSLVILATVKEPPRFLLDDPDEKEDNVQSPNGTEMTITSSSISPSISEPIREENDEVAQEVAVESSSSTSAVRLFLRPVVVVLFLASAIRMGAGLCFAYNNQIYFQMAGQSVTEIASWMSWVPATAGSLGCVLGGVISDRLAPKMGVAGRICVVITALILAAPCAAGVFFTNPPYCYLFLIGNYVVGEMWIGVCLSAVVELFPPHLRATAVGVYLFVISNIGGNMELLITPLRRHFNQFSGFVEVSSLRVALYIMYPGMFLVAAILFLVVLVLLKCGKSQNQYLAVPRGEGWERSHSNGRLKISNPMGGSRLLTTNIDGRRLLTTTDQSTVPVLDLAPNGRDSAGGGSGDMSGGGSGNGVVGGSGSGSEVVGNGRSSGSGSRWSGGWGSNGGASVAGGGSGAEEGGDVSRPLSRKLEEYAEVIEEEMIDHNNTPRSQSSIYAAIDFAKMDADLDARIVKRKSKPPSIKASSPHPTHSSPLSQSSSPQSPSYPSPLPSSPAYSNKNNNSSTLPPKSKKSLVYMRVVSQEAENGYNDDDVIVVTPSSPKVPTIENAPLTSDDIDNYYLQPIPSFNDVSLPQTVSSSTLPPSSPPMSPPASSLALPPSSTLPLNSSPKTRPSSSSHTLDRRKIPRPTAPPPPPVFTGATPTVRGRSSSTSASPPPASASPTASSFMPPPLPPVGEKRRVIERAPSLSKEANAGSLTRQTSMTGPSILGRPSSVHSTKSNSSETSNNVNNNNNNHLPPIFDPSLSVRPSDPKSESEPQQQQAATPTARPPPLPDTPTSPVPDLNFAYLLPNIVASPPQTTPPRSLSMESTPASPYHRNLSSFNTFFSGAGGGGAAGGRSSSGGGGGAGVVVGTGATAVPPDQFISEAAFSSTMPLGKKSSARQSTTTADAAVDNSAPSNIFRPSTLERNNNVKKEKEDRTMTVTTLGRRKKIVPNFATSSES